MIAVPISPSPHTLTLAELDANPWASCGPASLAALLERPLDKVRHSFPDNSESKTWTNLPRMCRALMILGLRVRTTAPDPTTEKGLPAKRWPTRGLVLIQFRGSWDALPVHHPAQLQRSHWVAVKPHPKLPDVPLVFDINAIDGFPPMSLGWWQPRECWERILVPQIAEHFGKRATGAWWVRAGLEVSW